jgi:hypothetical protein
MDTKLNDDHNGRFWKELASKATRPALGTPDQAAAAAGYKIHERLQLARKQTEILYCSSVVSKEVAIIKLFSAYVLFFVSA